MREWMTQSATKALLQVSENQRPTTNLTNHLAGLLQVQGKYVEAETLLKGAVESNRRDFGPGNPETLSTINNLALSGSPREIC